jgi:hypothetical protein
MHLVPPNPPLPACHLIPPLQLVPALLSGQRSTAAPQLADLFQAGRTGSNMGQNPTPRVAKKVAETRRNVVVRLGCTLWSAPMPQRPPSTDGGDFEMLGHRLNAPRLAAGLLWLVLALTFATPDSSVSEAYFIISI